MIPVKITAVVLILAGILGLAYGSLSDTRPTHEVDLGPIEVSVEETEPFNVPLWASVGAILIGGGLLFVGARKV